jgi:ABC-type sugar transport system permease subunit
VGPSASVKSSEQTQALLANGTISILLGGDRQIPFLQKNMTKHGWDVTYMPRDVAIASDLGGNLFASAHQNSGSCQRRSVSGVVHSRLSSPYWALPSLILTTLWVAVGFLMVVYLAALQAIPQMYYEAARK